MRQQSRAPLLQIMVCHLFDTKPLSLNQCGDIVNWTRRTKFSEILIKILEHFHARKLLTFENNYIAYLSAFFE